MNPDLPGQVQTSLNLGCLRLEEGAVRLTFSPPRPPLWPSAPPPRRRAPESPRGRCWGWRCPQENGLGHDFARDPLDLYVDGDWVKARGTSLGGDDGIAVAMAMGMRQSSSKKRSTFFGSTLASTLFSMLCSSLSIFNYSRETPSQDACAKAGVALL